MNWNNVINSKLLALACILFLILVLSACGGGGDGADTGRAGRPEPPPIVSPCGVGEFPDGHVCRVYAEVYEERVTTPFIEDGQPVTLQVVMYKPLESRRHPTLVFHHGSTGDGSDPARFGVTFVSETLARYFAERGWMVAFPQRRGRGTSGGHYDEGFTASRSGYSCRESIALAGAERALDDLDAVTDWLRQQADVDTSRMLVGGTSRGGILSLAHAARRPDVYLGAVNFAGGWLGEGCGDYRSVNRRLFVDGAAYPGPTHWLYGANDSFYRLTYSRSNFDAFSSAGGMGQFRAFTRAPGLNGHFLINDPDLWSSAMDQFLERL